MVKLLIFICFVLVGMTISMLVSNKVHKAQSVVMASILQTFGTALKLIEENSAECDAKKAFANAVVIERNNGTIPPAMVKLLLDKRGEENAFTMSDDELYEKYKVFVYEFYKSLDDCDVMESI